MRNTHPTPPQDGDLNGDLNGHLNLGHDVRQEPWLAHLALPPAARDEASAPDFVARVMRAPATQAQEPWLEWLAAGRDKTDTQNPEASVFEGAVFARRVMHALAAQQDQSRLSRLRLKEWAWRSAGGLAACLALVVAFWPTAKTTAPGAPASLAVGQTPASRPMASTLTMALQQKAEGWLDQQAEQASATLISTKNQVSTVLTEYAVPIKFSCYFLGLNLPVGRKPTDSSAAEQPRPHPLHSQSQAPAFNLA